MKRCAHTIIRRTVTRAGTTASLCALLVTAFATYYRIVPLDLGGGMTVQGTITTNGKMGRLVPSDISGWNLTVTTTSQLLFTPTNTRDISSGLFVDNGFLKVPTSPDGAADGGVLRVYAHSRLYAAVADFTGAFATGGHSYYCYGGDFDTFWLNRPNGTLYTLGQVTSGNHFSLFPVDFGSGTTLFGSVTTDGGLSKAQLVDWTIIVQHQTKRTFTKANSQVVEASAVEADMRSLKVLPYDQTFTPGRMVFGNPGMDPTLLMVADFSLFTEGVAGYIDPFTFQISEPLKLDRTGKRIAAQLAPISIRP